MPLEVAREVQARRPFYPALNGLRGLAILAVFLDHFFAFCKGLNWLSAGWIGVDIFFVLSGFLITGGLIDDAGLPDFFRVFYTKRALRIFPLYYGFWLLALLLRVFHVVSFPHLWWMWLVYLGNLKTFHQVAEGQLFSLQALTVHAGHRTGLLEINQFWSLCVEEQYYLIWPLVIYLVRDRRRLMILCVSLCCISLAARVAIRLLAPLAVAESEFIYHQTYVRMDGLFMGSFVALWLRGRETSRLEYRRLFGWTAAVSVSGFLAYFALEWHRAAMVHVPLVADLRSKWMSTVGFTLAPLLGTALVLGCLERDSLPARIFNFRPLRELGRISYGFYIIHVLPRKWYLRFIKRHPNPVLDLLLAAAWFVVCWGISWLSYQYFEQPFLRAKDRLSRSSGIPALGNAAERTSSPEQVAG